MELMFHESQVMVAVLLDLKRQGVIALPLHDAVIVPQSAADIAKDTMARTFRGQVGADPVINIKGIL